MSSFNPLKQGAAAPPRMIGGGCLARLTPKGSMSLGADFAFKRSCQPGPLKRDPSNQITENCPDQLLQIVRPCCSSRAACPEEWLAGFSTPSLIRELIRLIIHVETLNNRGGFFLFFFVFSCFFPFLGVLKGGGAPRPRLVSLFIDFSDTAR